MTFYPKRKHPIAFGGMKFDTSALAQDGKLTAGASGILSSGINMAFGDKVTTDERGFQRTKSIGNFAARKGLDWAAKGAQMGGIWGAVGGAVAGSVAGAFEGKKAKQNALSANNFLVRKNSNELISQGNSIFHQNIAKQTNQVYRKGGGFYPKSRNASVMFRSGGTILGGNLHEDGGNPVIDDSGKTVAETEREELVLGIRETEILNRLVELVDSDGSDFNFAQLGQMFKENILPGIKDNSGKFNINKTLPSEDF